MCNWIHFDCYIPLEITQFSFVKNISDKNGIISRETIKISFSPRAKEKKDVYV